MNRRKEFLENIEKGNQIAIEIKKTFRKNSSGMYRCICGEMASFSIANNNHIHFKCNYCNLSIDE